jgi:hypothetical protein
MVEMSELFPLEICVSKGEEKLQVMINEEKLGHIPPYAQKGHYYEMTYS